VDRAAGALITPPITVPPTQVFIRSRYIHHLLLVSFQVFFCQEFQTISIYGPPLVLICLKTLEQFLRAIDNGTKSFLNKTDY
jgi:hypothetical protein